jgi:hypothetical protein
MLDGRHDIVRLRHSTVRKMMIWRWIVCFVTASALFGVAADGSQKIRIIESTVNTSGNVVVLTAQIASKSRDLFCFTANRPCQQLSPGEYMMLSPSRTGKYRDCEANVDIYRISDPHRNILLGAFCLER